MAYVQRRPTNEGYLHVEMQHAKVYLYPVGPHGCGPAPSALEYVHVGLFLFHGSQHLLPHHWIPTPKPSRLLGDSLRQCTPRLSPRRCRHGDELTLLTTPVAANSPIDFRCIMRPFAPHVRCSCQRGVDHSFNVDHHFSIAPLHYCRLVSAW